MKKIQILCIFMFTALFFTCAGYYDAAGSSDGWYGGYPNGAAPGDYPQYEDGEEIEEFDPNNFDRIVENPFRHTGDYPISTFSIDVDTASYSIMRSSLNGNRMPYASSIRIEELVNYFDYDYAPPDSNDDKPFAVHTEVAPAPWNPDHYLARIAIKGKEFPVNERPRANLVFLIDVSGSMEMQNRLPLVISSLKMLVEELNGTDRVAICVYAGAAGTVLPPTNCDEKEKIISALKKLRAGGSTAGGAGIQLAYSLARQNFDPQAINRVIICTDGDFNVGITSQNGLIDLITEEAASGVYLTILGFGINNFKDGTMKQLSIHGNGNYGYIDTIEEARKILVNQLSGTLITIANDVKIQVEFNPVNVGAYRLIGYENRIMADEDFNNDKKNAGDIGAGHTVTAFYQIIPPGEEADALPRRDPLKYTPSQETGESLFSGELMTVKIRYKQPSESISNLISFPVETSSILQAGNESQEFRFASSVAGFGLLLRNSQYKGNANYHGIIDMARNAKGEDKWGLRGEFIGLVEIAGRLDMAESK